MIAPLKSVTVTSPFGTKGSQWAFGTHMGVDLRAAVGTLLYAPEDGVINERYVGTEDIKVLGLAGTKWHRFLHLDFFDVPLNVKVKQGQIIGRTGNTGQVAAHLHWDVRKPNTVWSASFSNYFDPMQLIKEGKNMSNIADEGFVNDVSILATGKEAKTNQNFLNNAGLPKEQVVRNFFGYSETKDYQRRAANYEKDVAAAGGEAKKTLDQIKQMIG